MWFFSEAEYPAAKCGGGVSLIYTGSLARVFTPAPEELRGCLAPGLSLSLSVVQCMSAGSPAGEFPRGTCTLRGLCIEVSGFPRKADAVASVTLQAH